MKVIILVDENIYDTKKVTSDHKLSKNFQEAKLLTVDTSVDVGKLCNEINDNHLF